MLKIISLLMIVFLSFAINAEAMQMIGFPGQTCTLLIDESANIATAHLYIDKAGQAIHYTSPLTICQLKFKAYNDTGSYSVYLQVWSDINRAGTQYGGDSNSVTIDAVVPTWYTFTWTSNMPQPTADYFIHIINAGDNITTFSMSDDPDAYESTSYDYFRIAVDRDWDMGFELWSMQ